MKNFTKVLFCLLIILVFIQVNVKAQNEEDFNNGNLKLVHDSLIIDKKKIDKLEKQIQQSLPQDLNPQVKISDSGDKNGDGKTDATTRTIYTHLDLTEIGMNRFIATQSFPPVSGTFPGTKITYTASISRPYISVRPNVLRASFTIYVSTSENNHYVIPVSPYLTYDLSYIYLSDIRAWFINFPELINNLNIPEMVKVMIIDQFNMLNLVIYPGKIINEANYLVPPYLNLWISDFIIGSQCMDRVLRLTLGVEVNAEPPYFNCQWLKRGPWMLSLRFYSGVETTLRKLKIWDVEDGWENDINIFMNKGTWTGQIDYPNPASVTTYFIIGVFSSPFGEYVRKWSLGFNTATYMTWFQANYRGGLN